MSDQTPADQVTPGQVFAEMPNHFQADKAGSTNATIQFDLTGDQGGKWWVQIAEGAASSGEGERESPNLTLTAAAGDYVKIALGQMDPTAAFMSGKLKIKGDMGLALKMASLFKRPS